MKKNFGQKLYKIRWFSRVAIWQPVLFCKKKTEDKEAMASLEDISWQSSPKDENKEYVNTIQDLMNHSVKINNSFMFFDKLPFVHLSSGQ